MSDASYRTIRIIDDYQKAFSAVNQHFLHAEISSEILQKVNLYLHEQGCHGDNTLFAQSVCSDEINFESGDISDVFTKRFGEVFELGGLGGIPFVDKSGFAAYSNHVPKDGFLLVLFAPHVGVTGDGRLGKYLRIGQEGRGVDGCSVKGCAKKEPGTACGAACGALQFCRAYMRQGAEAVQRCENGVLAPQAVAQTEWGVPTAEAAIAAATSACMGVGINGKEIFCLPVLGQGPDYQMDFLKLEVCKRLHKIPEDPSDPNVEQAALVNQMYEIAKENLKRIISFNTEGSATVYVLGGIQINMPGPMPGLFMPRMFKKFTRHSQTSLEHVIGIPDEDTPQSTDP